MKLHELKDTLRELEFIIENVENVLDSLHFDTPRRRKCEKELRELTEKKLKLEEEIEELTR